MRRTIGTKRVLIAVAASVAVLVVAVVAAVALSGGFESKVRVQSGTVVRCTYDHVVSDDVKTLEVRASEVGKYTVTTKTVTCDTHKEAERLYAEAQALIKKGDLKGAQAKLAEVVELDKTYKSAAAQLADIRAGKKPSSGDGGDAQGGGSGGGGSGSGGTTEPVGPIANLQSYIPDALDGYTAKAPTVESFRLIREYTPKSRPQVTWLVIVAEQFKDAASAKAGMSEQAKQPYPVGASTETVAGKSRYFGTDGRRFAVAAFTAGGVLVVIEGGVKDGSPAALKSELDSVMRTILK